MSDHKEQHNRVKELADEFRLKAHLATMEAKTLWEEELQPRLQQLDHKLDDATKRIDITEELSSIEKKLRKLLDDALESD